MLTSDRIYVMDCLSGVKLLADNSIQCCVTRPPYWCQRDYGVSGHYGLESTPELYVESLVTLFEEVRRVLKPDGTLWLNLGDAYWGSGKAGKNKTYQCRHREFGKLTIDKSRFGRPSTGPHSSLKPKDFIGLPWMVALALQSRGWWLRQDIIWHKTNPMQESIIDHCTRSHEFIFMLTKSSRYYYDAGAIKTEIKVSSRIRELNAVSGMGKYAKEIPGRKGVQGIYKARGKKQDFHHQRDEAVNERYAKGNLSEKKGANRRDVWAISNKRLKERHFAAFPIEIPELCIKAGSRPNDLILDPFIGSGTTALAAALLQRHFIGFELNAEYVKIANRRLKNHLGLFYQQ